MNQTFKEVVDIEAEVEEILVVNVEVVKAVFPMKKIKSILVL